MGGSAARGIEKRGILARHSMRLAESFFGAGWRQAAAFARIRRLIDPTYNHNGAPQ
jgi:hypothetical protein